MQYSAKMNMVTFSAFEKQICNILHFLHIFRVHAGANNRARRVKNTPAALKTPTKHPRANRLTAPHQAQKRPKLRVKNSMEPPTGKLHRYHVSLEYLRLAPYN